MEGDLEVKNEEAYALVTATYRGTRYVLLIERRGGAWWAMPGGVIEPGERPRKVAFRELSEKTRIDMIRLAWRTATFTQDEPRDGIVVARCDLGEVDELPEVRGGGDARCAAWRRIDRLDQYMDVIFPAHREILGALR